MHKCYNYNCNSQLAKDCSNKRNKFNKQNDDHTQGNSKMLRDANKTYVKDNAMQWLQR